MPYIHYIALSSWAMARGNGAEINHFSLSRLSGCFLHVCTPNSRATHSGRGDNMSIVKCKYHENIMFVVSTVKHPGRPKVQFSATAADEVNDANLDAPRWQEHIGSPNRPRWAELDRLCAVP